MKLGSDAMSAAIRAFSNLAQLGIDKDEWEAINQWFDRLEELEELED